MINLEPRQLLTDLVGAAVGHEPGWRRKQGGAAVADAPGVGEERRPHHTLLRSVEQQAVVDDSNTTLNVVHGVPRERTPASLCQQEADARPRIDTDAAVSEPRDGPVQGCSVAVCGCRMDDDVCAERPPEPVIAEVDSAVKVIVA